MAAAAALLREVSMSAAWMRPLARGAGTRAGAGEVCLTPARSLNTSTWQLAEDQAQDKQLITVDEKLLVPVQSIAEGQLYRGQRQW